ncbi:polysaccharide pyruvyl transferase family protein [Marinimicrobium locisalis]|uniref:polysaccharide pyruvyl transferase family protein n=1 Tax=Marinimicrobium locisalis TaxID=546022 RepID=UPI00322175CA
MSSIKLFWWRPKDGSVNLGDEISRILFERLFEVTVKRAAYPGANVNSTGSTLGWAFDREDFKQRTQKMVVLGSGLMHPWHQIEDYGWLDIRLVRGYLTRSVLSRTFGEGAAIGDPGLLVSDLLPSEKPTKKFRYGVIPHISKVENDSFYQRFDDLRSATFISFKTDDIDTVLRKMMECEIIISQSLHGVIFSDALGLPNVWLDAGSLHPGGSFKFYDYFSSINRPFDKGVKVGPGDRIDETVERELFTPDMIKVNGVKEVIREEVTRALREFS